MHRRILLVITCALTATVASTAAGAQSAHQPRARWEAGPAVLTGIGVHIGGSVSFNVIEARRLSLSADVSGFAPAIRQLEWACLNASGCSNGEPPPQASSLVSVGVRATVPVSGRWYALADVALVEGQWRYPVAGTHRAAAGGLGLGHRSRTQRQALEVRWQHVGSGGAPVSTWRVGWLHRW
jgi:hypothetical protein